MNAITVATLKWAIIVRQMLSVLIRMVVSVVSAKKRIINSLIKKVTLLCVKVPTLNIIVRVDGTIFVLQTLMNVWKTFVQKVSSVQILTIHIHAPAQLVSKAMERNVFVSTNLVLYTQ